MDGGLECAPAAGQDRAAVLAGGAAPPPLERRDEGEGRPVAVAVGGAGEPVRIAARFDVGRLRNAPALVDAAAEVVEAKDDTADGVAEIAEAGDHGARSTPARPTRRPSCCCAAPAIVNRHAIAILGTPTEPQIAAAQDAGPLIRSKAGFWLAIPTPAAGKALGGRRITPAAWERQTGLQLRFVYRRTGPSLRAADGARINSRGLAAVSRSKTGRGQVTAPVFLLVPQVKLPKRLDLMRDAERAQGAAPGLIVANWVEARPQ